jgi:large subunit ribosomal protein L15
MKLNSLEKIIKNKRRRLGQGHGSGRVKTSGRGTKGQNARSNRSLSFEGGALPLTKRLPFLRGKDKNNSYAKKLIVVNVSSLEILKQGAIVDLKTLISNNIVSQKDADKWRVKILGSGVLKKALTIKLPISKSAAEKVQKAGGRVELDEQKVVA